MAKKNKLETIIEGSNLTDDEIVKLIKQYENGKPMSYSEHKLPLTSKHIKFGVLSDTHMGHKNYRPDVLEHAIKNFNKEKVDFVCMPGDILEGMSGREGHIYELAHVGATNQINYGISQLEQIKQPIYAITATNSHDGWFSSKKDMGYEVGPELERRVKNFNFLGYDEVDLKLDNGLILRMSHPGDGTAYAISYKMQKYLNAIDGGKKPHILLQGHYHKMNQMFYRGVHGFDCGSLENQTTFMKKKQTPSHVGYWLIDVVGSKKGVDRIKSEFVPFYE